jgi:hypothetical protein
MLLIRVSVKNASNYIRPESKGVYKPSKFKEVLRIWADTRHLFFVI